MNVAGPADRSEAGDGAKVGASVDDAGAGDEASAIGTAPPPDPREHAWDGIEIHVPFASVHASHQGRGDAADRR